MYELGREGFFRAMKGLAGEPAEPRRLPVSIVARESTGPPRA
jgi:hypothetical protein